MMVFVMVFVASIFFLLADQVMRLGVSFLLGINS
jgi:preprotein translocase subunit SecE